VELCIGRLSQNLLGDWPFFWFQIEGLPKRLIGVLPSPLFHFPLPLGILGTHFPKVLADLEYCSLVKLTLGRFGAPLIYWLGPIPRKGLLFLKFGYLF